jgi:hypothetical protein
MKLKQVALYMRCSTDDQTVDLQRRDLLPFCLRHSDWHVIEYVDAGQSGAKTTRPALDRLMEDVRRGKIDVAISEQKKAKSRRYRQGHEEGGENRPNVSDTQRPEDPSRQARDVQDRKKDQDYSEGRVNDGAAHLDGSVGSGASTTIIALRNAKTITPVIET